MEQKANAEKGQRKKTKKKKKIKPSFSRTEIIKILKKQINMFKNSDSYYAQGFNECLMDIISELKIEELIPKSNRKAINI